MYGLLLVPFPLSIMTLDFRYMVGKAESASAARLRPEDPSPYTYQTLVALLGKA